MTLYGVVFSISGKSVIGLLGWFLGVCWGYEAMNERSFAYETPQPSSTLATVLRWVVVVPASVAGGILGALLLLVLGRVPMAMVGADSETGWRAAVSQWIMVIWAPNFLNGALVIVLAFVIAPSHKWRVATAIGAVHAVSMVALTAMRANVSSTMIVQLIALVAGTVGAIAYLRFSGIADAGSTLS